MSRWWLLALSGCVIHVDDLDGGSDLYADLEVVPAEVPAGERALLSVELVEGSFTFGDVEGVRSLGDFRVEEVSAQKFDLDVVVQIDEDAQGEQVLAVDLDDGSLFTSFWVY